MASLVGTTIACLISHHAFAQGTVPIAGAAASAAVASDTKVERPAMQTSPSDELATLQAQIPILEAKAKIAKLNADIAAAQAGPQQQSNSTPPVPAQPQPSVAAMRFPVVQQRSDTGMRAVSISAFDGVYHASIVVNGEETPVTPGQSVDGGWTVKSITDSAVTLVRGKQTVVLRG